jgi:hypothetical protein
MTMHISQAIDHYTIETFNSLLKDYENGILDEEYVITWLENMVKTLGDRIGMRVSSESISMIRAYGNGLPLIVSYIDPQTLNYSGHLVIPALETLLSRAQHTWLDTL